MGDPRVTVRFESRSADSALDAVASAGRLLAAYVADCRTAEQTAQQLRDLGIAAHATGDVVELPADAVKTLLDRLTTAEQRVKDLEMEKTRPPF